MTGRVPVIAVVGRTNVGKSTLFNQISGRRQSIVEDSPGVTRDRNYAYVKRFDYPFLLVDTGGLVGEEETELADSVRKQTDVAIEEADALIVVFDGIAGLHVQDQEVTDHIRRSNKPAFWVVNKCEKQSDRLSAGEFYQLGLEQLTYISAQQDIGVDTLIEKILAFVSENYANAETRTVNEKNSITLTILGKPNVGKSTLLNQLLGEERVVVSELPGTTRDSIYVDLEHAGQIFTIVDTAGLRKKNKIADHTVERYSTLRTLRALAEADVAALMLDASSGVPSDQDKKIASLIHERGRGLIIVVNKWDLVEKDYTSVKSFVDVIHEALPFANYAPIIFTTAISGRRCVQVLNKAKEVYAAAHERVKTSELNRTLKRIFDKTPPPAYKGAQVKLAFATQTEVAPPTIVIFVSHVRGIKAAYERYLKNSIRKVYNFEGVDIRLIIRKRSKDSLEEERQR